MFQLIKETTDVQLKLDSRVAFPAFVESQAVAVAANPPVDDLAALRQDLTGHMVLAIDDSRTTEVDDAVSVLALEGGGWRVWVHVSQPCAVVSLGDPLDLEARRRYECACTVTNDFVSADILVRPL